MNLTKSVVVAAAERKPIEMTCGRFCLGDEIFDSEGLAAGIFMPHENGVTIRFYPAVKDVEIDITLEV